MALWGAFVYIRNLKLINFRNYHQLELSLHPKVNIFVGDNAQGKTNILEAIYMTAAGKSFRTTKDREIIKMDKQQGYVKIEGVKRHGKVTVELKLEEEKKKQVRVNGLTLTKRTDLLGNVYVVIFSPEDLRLVKEGPAERRRFIDQELSNIKPKYFHHLNQYHKVLMQRNNLLKKIQQNRRYMETLEIWDEKLAELGTKLMFERMSFVNRLSMLSKLVHRKITDNRETLELKYQSSIPMKHNDAEMKAFFMEKLQETLEKDINRGSTTIGPHRDDLGLIVNGIDIRIFGSQGQQRTTALALKLAEIELVKGETGEYPILLLDDVMSELDPKRQQFLIKSLRDIQTFVTTTELNSLETMEFNEKEIFYVEHAHVKPYVKD